jgi:hypothetical protein
MLDTLVILQTTYWPVEYFNNYNSSNNCNNSIQFNSIQFIYVQNLTAQRPITKLGQARKWEE